METVIFVALALVLFALLTVQFGADSRPVDDTRHWWPATHDDDAAYPQHHA
jgi:hypothetical protein